jgi:UDP-N-acetylmuramate--alanine ligase
MSALAEILADRGLIVTGSDRQENEATIRLKERGILVEIGESGLYLPGADVAIRTAAAREENPEVVAARGMGLPLIERADAWGELMRGYKTAVCVAGTHGKTTTTGMLAHITWEAGLDPTVMLGGRLPLFDSGHRVGEGGVIIAEACEYHNSYHRFHPTTAVILNIDADHLDFFSGLADMSESFTHFAGLVPEEGGIVVANGEDLNTRAALNGLHKDRRIVWFGKGCQVRASKIVHNRGRYSFTVVADEKVYASIRLKVPGKHNMQNALAAAAAAWANGMPGAAVGKGLSGFSGAGRRMEYIGTVRGAELYDDYAHHPSEVTAALAAVRQMGAERTVCIFQPHTYTRAKAFFEEYISALSGFDRVYLTGIYAARETDPGDISSQMLAERIPGAIYEEDFQVLAKTILNDTYEGDLIITMGAGDVNKVGNLLSVNC